MAQEVSKVRPSYLSSPQAEGATIRSATLPNRERYLPEGYDHEPHTLAACPDETSAFNPTWLAFLEQGETTKALQIVEAELEALLETGCRLPASIGRCKYQIGISYLLLDAPQVAERFFREAFDLFERPTAFGVGRHERIALSAIWFETLILLHEEEDGRVPLGRLRSLYHTEIASAPPAEQAEKIAEWAMVLQRTIAYCTEHEAWDLVEEIYPELLTTLQHSFGPYSLTYLDAKCAFGEYYYATFQSEACAQQFAELQSQMEQCDLGHGMFYGIACLRQSQCAVERGDIHRAEALLQLAERNIDHEDETSPLLLRDIYLVKAHLSLHAGNIRETVKYCDLSVQVVKHGQADHLLALYESNLELLGAHCPPEVEERWLRTALDIAESHCGAHDERTVAAHQHLIAFLDRAGRFGNVRLEQQRYLDRDRKAFGPTSYEYIDGLFNLALTHLELELREQGEHLLLRALEEARRSLELPQRMIILDILEALGDYHRKRDDFEQEMHYRDLGARLARRYVGPLGTEYGRMLLAVAQMHEYWDEPTLSEVAAECAIMIFDSQGDAYELLAEALAQKGSARAAQGYYVDAEFLYRQALETLALHDGSSSVVSVIVLDRLAECILRQSEISPDSEREREALDYLVRAAELCDELSLPDYQHIVDRHLMILKLAKQHGEESLAERSTIVLARLYHSGLLDDDDVEF